MREVVLFTVRTPHRAYKGTLAPPGLVNSRPSPIKARSPRVPPLPPRNCEDGILGCADVPEQKNRPDVSHASPLRADWPEQISP